MDLLDRLGGADPTGVAVLVDGPNVFREAFEIEFADLRRTAAEHGRVAVARVYLDSRAPSGLIQAAETNGFEVVVTSGDVDVRLAVEATELVTTGTVATLAIASRDQDFKPVLEAAGRHGVRTVAIAPGSHGRSAGLSAAADEAITLGE